MQSVCHKPQIEYVRNHARDLMYEMSSEEGRSLENEARDKKASKTLALELISTEVDERTYQAEERTCWEKMKCSSWQEHNIR